MKILVTGSTGGLGKELYQHFKKAGHDVTGTWHQNSSSEGVQMNLDNLKNIQKIFAAKAFDVCFHTAGIANPDICEENPDLAHRINVQGSTYIQQACEENGVRPVFFSTDYVFSGDRNIYFEDDKPDPLQVYGRTKAEAEEVFLKDPQSVILRIGLLYNNHHGPFRAIYENLRNDSVKELYFSKKQIRYPLHTNDVCYYAEQILHEGGPPIIHLAGADPYSKHEAALLLADFSQCYKPIIAAESHVQQAKRPNHVDLSLDRLKKHYPYQATNFETEMSRCVSVWKLNLS